MNEPTAVDKLILFRRVRDAIATAALWFLLGFGTARLIAPGTLPGPAPPAPAPAPAPVPLPSPAPGPLPPPPPPPPAAAVHTGHLNLSLIEPYYPTPAAAAVRHDLASTDWGPLDTTFRAYTHGQEELSTLGFTRLYAAADLPIVFYQETRPDGSAPLIDPPTRSPSSAAVVVDRVRKLRGL